MAVIDGAIRTTFKVTPGNSVLRVSGISSGTMYAVYFKPLCNARVGAMTVPASAGPGGQAVALLDLPVEAQTLLAGFKSETGATNYPAGVFVAGASVAYNRVVPQFSPDGVASTEISRVLRVAAPDFNNPTHPGLSHIEVRVSRDGGSTFPEVTKLLTPFPNNLNYGVLSIQVPYETEVKVVGQSFFKDGTAGRTSRPLVLRGFAKPDNNTLGAPTITSASGTLAYSNTTNSVRLSLTVSGIPDAGADSLQIRVINAADGSVKDSKILPVGSDPTAVLTAVFDNLDASVATYTVKAASVKYGVPSIESSTDVATPSSTTYRPNKINPATVTLSEVIERPSTGGIVSKIQVKWAADNAQPKANIYLRRRDTFGGDTNSFTGFNLAGSSATMSFLTDPVTAGATVTWDVVVLAVGVTGTEAAFSVDQIKTVAVQAYANYAPLSQSMPTVTVLNDDQVSLKGTYTRPSNTPMPVAVNIYKSESATDSANLVAKVPLQPSNDPTIYNWQYDVQSLKTQFANAGVSLIVVRYALENGTESSNANKNVVKVLTQAPGTAPILSGAAAYVKTIGASVSNGTATLTSSTGSYTPGNGGTGTLLTLTPPLNNIILEVSDGGGTPGLNPENITPSIDGAAPNFSLIATPTKNTGTRNIRARFSTVYGMSGYSNAIQITFPVDNVVDATPPDLTPCQPRFVCNADGSIKITWSAAAFGSSGLGSYAIRRSATNDVNASYTVGLTTTSTTLSWTDALPSDKQGYTYYYWLEATSAQGVKSASPVAVKLSSANTYAVETVTGAASVDAIPSTVGSITSVGAQGGFNVTWAGVADRDLKEYVLEFSALGNFTDTVTVSVKSNSYYQTLGATASSATATAYRWRVKAKDFANQVSAAYATSAAPDLTNYGSVQDSAPTAASAPTLTANTDGSITITLVASSAPYFHIKRLSNASSWAPASSGSGDNSKIEAEIIIDGASTRFNDTGLNPSKWYTYQVFTRSKLGTDATTFPAPPSPVQPTIIVKGVMRPSLIFNGHFGKADGSFGTTYNGWTLQAGATYSGPTGTYSYNGVGYSTATFAGSGTALKVLSQKINVIPGKTYTVMGILWGLNAAQGGGRSYIRISGATVTPVASGSGTPPAPYTGAPVCNGQDYTSTNDAYNFITYSFTVPTGVYQVNVDIGWESRGQSGSCSTNPAFVQVFLDE